MPTDPDTLARLVYLTLFLLVIGGAFLFGQRRRPLRNLRDFLIWVLIFAGVVIAYGFRDTLREQLFPSSMVTLDDGTIELRRGSDGHFHATLEVNGAPVRFMVDTGASSIVLSRRDARRVGIDPDALAYLGRARTANGIVPIADVRLERVEFAGYADTGVRASVTDGLLETSLLGMAYLDRFERIEISGDRMRLVR
jgi:aspartyl protease family protein